MGAMALKRKPSVQKFIDNKHPPLVAVAQEGVRVSVWGPRFWVQLVTNFADTIFKGSPLVAVVQWVDVSVLVGGQGYEALEGFQRDVYRHPPSGTRRRR